MSAEFVVLVALAAPVIAYLVVRFGAAAYFKSKQQYEREKQNES